MFVNLHAHREIGPNERLPAHVIWIGNQIPDQYIQTIIALARKFPDRYPAIVWASNPELIRKKLEEVGASTEDIKVVGLYAAADVNPRLSNVDFLIDAAANRIGANLSDFLLPHLQNASQREIFIHHVNSVSQIEAEAFGQQHREAHSLEDALEIYRQIFVDSFKHTYSYYIDVAKNLALKPKPMMAGAADALRLLILDHYKGTYLDIDSVLLNEPSLITAGNLGQLFTLGYAHFYRTGDSERNSLSQRQFFDGLNAVLRSIHSTPDIQNVVHQQAPSLATIFAQPTLPDVHALTYTQRRTLSEIIPQLPDDATRTLALAFVHDSDHRRFEQTPAGEWLMINRHASDLYIPSFDDGTKRREPYFYNNNYINVTEDHDRFRLSVLLEGYRRLHEITPETFALRPAEVLLEQLDTASRHAALANANAGHPNTTEYLERSDFLGLHLFTEGKARFEGIFSFVGPGLLRQQISSELYGQAGSEKLHTVEPDVSIGRLFPEQKSNTLYARTVGNTRHSDIKVVVEKEGHVITGATIHRRSYSDQVLDLATIKHHRITYSDGVTLILAAEQHAGSNFERLELRQALSSAQQIFQLLSDGKKPRHFQSHANTFEHEQRSSSESLSPHLIELGIFESPEGGAMSWAPGKMAVEAQQLTPNKDAGATYYKDTSPIDQQVHQMINQRLTNLKLASQKLRVHPLEAITYAEEVVTEGVSDKRLLEMNALIQQNFHIIEDWWKKQKLISALHAKHGEVLIDKSNDLWSLTLDEGRIELPAFLPNYPDSPSGLKFHYHEPGQAVLETAAGSIVATIYVSPLTADWESKIEALVFTLKSHVCPTSNETAQNFVQAADKSEIAPQTVPESLSPSDGRKWIDHAVIYEVYAPTFAIGEQDEMSKLRNVTQRLDYIKSLSVTALWLTPFTKAPSNDHFYAPTSFTEIDPRLGTQEELEGLINVAHGKVIKVMIDLVLNHTSNQHPWFIESAQATTNAQAASESDNSGGTDKKNWYVWMDGDDPEWPPTNWHNQQGGSSWQWHDERRSFYYANFSHSMPSLNLSNPEVRAEVHNTVKHWLKLGVDGFRLDAMPHFFFDKELRDQEAGRPFRTTFQQEPITELVREIRDICDSSGRDIAILGECCEVPALDPVIKARHFLRENVADTVFANTLGFEGKDTHEFRDALMYALHGTPTSKQHAWASGSHDHMRGATRHGGANPSQAFIKSLAVLYATLPGTMLVYQGEELGLQQPSPEAIRTAHPLFNVLVGDFPNNTSREAFPWQAQQLLPNACVGLSDANRENAVDKQELRDDSVLKHYRMLLAWRQNCEALTSNNISFIDDLPAGVLGYQRTNQEKSKKINCYFNFSEKEIVVPIKRGTEAQECMIALAPDEYAVTDPVDSRVIACSAYQFEANELSYRPLSVKGKCEQRKTSQKTP